MFSRQRKSMEKKEEVRTSIRKSHKNKRGDRLSSYFTSLSKKRHHLTKKRKKTSSTKTRDFDLERVKYKKKIKINSQRRIFNNETSKENNKNLMNKKIKSAKYDAKKSNFLSDKVTSFHKKKKLSKNTKFFHTTSVSKRRNRLMSNKLPRSSFKITPNYHKKWSKKNHYGFKYGAKSISPKTKGNKLRSKIGSNISSFEKNKIKVLNSAKHPSTKQRHTFHWIKTNLSLRDPSPLLNDDRKQSSGGRFRYCSYNSKAFNKDKLKCMTPSYVKSNTLKNSSMFSLKNDLPFKTTENKKSKSLFPNKEEENNNSMFEICSAEEQELISSENYKRAIEEKFSEIEYLKLNKYCSEGCGEFTTYVSFDENEREYKGLCQSCAIELNETGLDCQIIKAISESQKIKKQEILSFLETLKEMKNINNVRLQKLSKKNSEIHMFAQKQRNKARDMINNLKALLDRKMVEIDTVMNKSLIKSMHELENYEKAVKIKDQNLDNVIFDIEKRYDDIVENMKLEDFKKILPLFKNRLNKYETNIKNSSIVKVGALKSEAQEDQIRNFREFFENNLSTTEEKEWSLLGENGGIYLMVAEPVAPEDDRIEELEYSPEKREQHIGKFSREILKGKILSDSMKGNFKEKSQLLKRRKVESGRGIRPFDEYSHEEIMNKSYRTQKSNKDFQLMKNLQEQKSQTLNEKDLLLAKGNMEEEDFIIAPGTNFKSVNDKNEGHFTLSTSKSKSTIHRKLENLGEIQKTVKHKKKLSLSYLKSNKSQKKIQHNKVKSEHYQNFARFLVNSNNAEIHSSNRNEIADNFFKVNEPPSNSKFSKKSISLHNASRITHNFKNAENLSTEFNLQFYKRRGTSSKKKERKPILIPNEEEENEELTKFSLQNKHLSSMDSNLEVRNLSVNKSKGGMFDSFLKAKKNREKLIYR